MLAASDYQMNPCFSQFAIYPPETNIGTSSRTFREGNYHFYGMHTVAMFTGSLASFCTSPQWQLNGHPMALCSPHLPLEAKVHALVAVTGVPAG